MRTVRQQKSAVAQKARARLRLEQICQHSKAGSTKAETAAAIGMTVSRIDAALYRNFGTVRWPVEEEE